MKTLLLTLLLASCGAEKDPLGSATNLATTGSTEGSKGDKGDKGERGDAGKDGVTTTVIKETATTPAKDGVDANSLNVIDINGAVIGQLYGLDGTTNRYWILKGKIRFEVSRADGTFPQGWVFYSGANCTGTSRVGIINGQFASVVIEPQTNAILKAKGAQINNFAYASRRAAGNCSNTSSTANRVFEHEVYSPEFTYPVLSPEVANQ